MPIDPVTGSLIETGMQVGGNIHANSQNRRAAAKQRHESREQWKRERNFALEMWHKQNEYNSPVAQMARFKEAGLNPNLIYGQGTSGNASTYSTPSADQYTREDLDSVTRGVNTFQDYYNFRQLQAQTDNVRAQTNVAEQEALIKAQRVLREAVGLQSDELNYKLSKGTIDYNIEAAKENLNLLQNNARKSAVEADISEVTKNPKIKGILNDILLGVEKLKGERLENFVRHKNAELAKEGLRDTDNVIMRYLILNGMNPLDLLKWFGKTMINPIIKF